MAVVEVKGTRRLQRILDKGKKLSGSAAARVRKEVDVMALHVMRRAMKRVPHRKGPLMQSARSAVAATSRSGLAVEVVFGGAAAAYAEVQHAREDFLHKSGRVDHYLYGRPHSAWNAPEERLMTKRVSDRILDEYERAFGGT